MVARIFGRNSDFGDLSPKRPPLVWHTGPRIVGAFPSSLQIQSIQFDPTQSNEDSAHSVNVEKSFIDSNGEVFKVGSYVSVCLGDVSKRVEGIVCNLNVPLQTISVLQPCRLECGTETFELVEHSYASDTVTKHPRSALSETQKEFVNMIRKLFSSSFPD